MKVCSACGKEKDEGEFGNCVCYKDGVCRACKSCRKAYQKEYRKDNKKKLAARKKKYQQDNKERRATYEKEYRQNNKGKIATYKKKYHQDNKEKIAAFKKKYHREHKEEKTAYNKKYCQENREKIVAGRKKYYQNHKEKIKEYSQTPAGKATASRTRHKRRAQRLGAGYEKFDSIEIFERDGWRCQRCHKKVRPDFNCYHSLYPNLDHIVCLANGGNHSRKNTQLLCRQCNMKKHNNDSFEQTKLFGI